MVLPPTASSSISLPSGECTFLATSCHYTLCFEAEKQKIILAVIAVSGHQLQLEGFCKSYLFRVIKFFPYLFCGYGHINVYKVLPEN